MAQARVFLTGLPQPAPKTPTASKTLASLREQNEDATSSVDEASLDASSKSSRPPQTPAGSSPIKPPMFQMHPSKVHPTTAEPSSGLQLGFTDIKPTERTSQTLMPGVKLSTPSKPSLRSSPFNFRFTRPTGSDIGLSSDAQRMMDELREDALKIKADLTAQRQKELEEEQAGGRKIARPKGKAGRFSAAHMAEFKKMDSIENHFSALRATQAGKPGQPSKGVKRSQSKANLEDAEPGTVERSLPSPPKKSALLFPGEHRLTSKKSNLLFPEEPVSAAKRARQHMDDDASSSRPVSRDGSFLPRPTTAGKDSAGIPRSLTMASIMTPTKASLARAASVKSPAAGSLVRSASRPNLGGLAKSATVNNLQAVQATAVADPITSPGRLARVKSIIRGQKKVGPTEKGTGLPQPMFGMSKTPAAARLEKPLPQLPATTPRRKLQKRTSITPKTKRAILMQNSPSPFKSAIPRSATRTHLAEVRYPTLDTVLADQASDGSVSYPDLSSHRPLPEPPVQKAAAVVSPAVPGTFTFRSDHTISFDHPSPTGFGASPGQASLRQVRPSIMPMPGSFPASVATRGSDKENQAPVPLMPAVAHGLPNKKRNRAVDDEDAVDAEAGQRAAKKRKNEPVPEGDALLAPRLMGKTLSRPGFSSPMKPSQLVGFGTPRSASPSKKKPVLSLSRLHMLSRPKTRK